MDHVKHSRSEFGCPAHFPVLKWQNPNKEGEKLMKEKFQQFEEEKKKEVRGLSHEWKPPLEWDTVQLSAKTWVPTSAVNSL